MAETTASPPPTDDKLEALERLCGAIAGDLAEGLTLARDNPGRTPPAWSVTGRDGALVLTFGLVDRTFFWTWDEGVSNHYAKDAGTMRAVILEEMRRFGHLV
jgi:hypothetical protein